MAKKKFPNETSILHGELKKMKKIILEKFLKRNKNISFYNSDRSWN